MAKAGGRRKGSRNKGYYFRSGRGWYVFSNGKYVPLLDENGLQVRDKDTSQKVLRELSQGHETADATETADTYTEEKLPEIANPGVGIEVGEICGNYLDHLKAAAGEFDTANPRGKAKTYVDRGQTLFDFCYGLPGEFFCLGDLEKRKRKGDPEPKRIHDGFGHKLHTELTPIDVDKWLKAHKWTAGGWRTRIQALKRAFNFAIERRVISESPIRGYKLPKSVARITYLTPAQEAEMIKIATPAFGIAMKICIRTGARFGVEFAPLTANHVRDHGDKMEWVFKAEESKTKKLRIIRITDPEIMKLTRKGMAEHPMGPIFRNQYGECWTRKILSMNFRRTKKRLLRRKKIALDPDACMYSCRHTYAKRTLEGYWTGKPASITSLARLMGNSVQVCIDHYLQFSIADNEMLWTSA